MPTKFAHVSPEVDAYKAFISALDRNSLDVLDFVVGTDELGSPILSEAAPNLCENPY